jgi:hypothetical protein
MAQEAVLRTPVVFEPHGRGYQLWAELVFTRLVFAIEGVTRVQRAAGGGCWEVSVDPRYDSRQIEAAVYALVQFARSSPGVAKWLH